MQLVARFFNIFVDNTDSHPYICALFCGITTPSLRGMALFYDFQTGFSCTESSPKNSYPLTNLRKNIIAFSCFRGFVFEKYICFEWHSRGTSEKEEQK